MYKKSDPGGRFDCFHNGIILIVISFKIGNTKIIQLWV